VIQNSKALMGLAGQFGQLDILMFLCGRVSAAGVKQNLEFTFLEAAWAGHSHVVKYLCECQGVDPSLSDNQAVKWAAFNCHVDVVRYLCSLPGVNPAADKNCALRTACWRVSMDVLKLLCEHPGVVENIAALDKSAVRLAACHGHLSIVQYLCEFSNVDPGANENYALKWAALEGHIDVVKYLCGLSKVNPFDFFKDEAKVCKADRAHPHVVKFLRGITATKTPVWVWTIAI